VIYSFGAKNFYSFKDGFDVSFELNSKVPKSVSMGLKVSPVMGIKGGNASGKTHILKMLQCLSHFCTRSFTFDRDYIFLESYYGNNKPTEFYVDFMSNDIRYIYELKATKDKVIREAIYKKVSRKTLLIERTENKLTKTTSDFDPLSVIILKSSASLIDTVPQYNLSNIPNDLSNIHSFFKAIYGNVSAAGVMDDKDFYDYKSVNEIYHKVPNAFEFAKQILINSDLGIADIKLHERENEKGEVEHFPIFYHNYKNTTDKYLTFWHQSDGTRALYRRLQAYYRALSTGGILVMDEFDTNYHPDLLPQLLDLFLDPKINTRGAQFLFTSHNLEIIDHLGKYRTILVSKDEGESYCYRLDEIPGDIIRNDRPISPLYREGKLGGVPKL